MTSVVQSFIESFSTLTYELESYSEERAKYPNCMDQFRVNFTVSPQAAIRSTTTNGVTQCNIISLQRCMVYDIVAKSYRGEQLMGTVNASDSVMTSKLCMASYRACIVLQVMHLR